jgi:small subunit ribosomal protein S5
MGETYRNQNHEFEQKLIDLARVTRVVKGGRRFRFRATMAIGNRRGKVGIGVAKGADVSSAISKAFNKAKKSIVQVRIYQGTIPHLVRCKFKSARVLLKPAKKGRGIVVGGAVRSIVELAGISDMSAKILKRGNKVNNAMAALIGLASLKDFSKGKDNLNIRNKQNADSRTKTKKQV